jgi:hypothetical protein
VSDEKFPWSEVPAPAGVEPTTLTLVRRLGEDAGLAGRPPSAPAGYEAFTEVFVEGWLAGRKRRQQPDGWQAIVDV